MYVAAFGRDEIVAYTPETVAELLATSPVCKPGAEQDELATFDCVLRGEVNPFEVPEAKISFDWGRTCTLGTETSVQEIQTGNAPVEVSTPVGGLRPNERFCYRLNGHDQHVKDPEVLTSETVAFLTPTVPPKVVGEPNVSFVTSSSAVMFGKLNPENTNSNYAFEYGPCENPESCAASPYPSRTATQASAAYGEIGATLEASGLRAGTLYHYRLAAINEKGEPALNAANEGSFRTALAPAPQAVTGSASLITTRSALVNGTVNPDGQAATYTFEVGLYNGASTQYGIVFSGPVAATTIPVQENQELTGLLPGRIYAYRIGISSGYVKNEAHVTQGTPSLFQTAGLPEVLTSPSVLAQLPIPPIAFPKEPATLTPKKLTRAQQLAHALKACAKKPKSKRAACRRAAHKKYGTTSRKKKK